MKQSKKQQWLDISTLLSSGMVHWPQDPAVEIKRVKSAAFWG